MSEKFCFVLFCVYSKQKFYDGNESLKMTGEDCRMLEENIAKFVQHLLQVSRSVHV